jgi:transcriptional regulator with XRE-family HTH domain
MAQTLGEWIRTIRQSKGLTQRAVAARMRIDDYYISRLETNHINPTLLTLQKLADALEVEVSAFFASERLLEAHRTAPSMDKKLRKVLKLWKGLTGQHRQLMLWAIEEMHRFDQRHPSRRGQGR